MKRALTITENHGGLSTDLKQGTDKSFGYAKHIDFRKRPTGLSILPKTTKESGSIVTGLVTQMIQLPSGKMVAVDDVGGVYQRSTSGVWTKNGTSLADTAYGMVYSLQYDTIFVPGLNSLHTITNADGRFSGGTFTVNGAAIGTSVDQASSAGHVNTYTSVAAISEIAVDMRSFTPTIEPLTSVDFWVTTKGTGSVTVTMHDQSNNILGAVTIAAASLTNGAYNTFTFTNPIRTTASPNQTSFHFHITHSGGTASTIGASTASSLATGDYQTKVNRFVNSINGMHPTMQFLQYILFANERYVSAWEVGSSNPTAPSNVSYKRHILTFPSGYEMTSMATYTEYAAFAVEKKSSVATNEFQDGRIYFWDGVSVNYNFQISVPEGSPYSLFSYRNVLYWVAAGALWAWSGGEPVKVFQFPSTDFEYSDTNTYLVNYPNMMAVRNSILMTGFPSQTSSTSVQHGIYSWGSRNKNYRESFGYSYTSSNGTNTNGALKLGMVKSFGDKMFVSWKDGSSYGVDIVDSNSDPFATATLESLIFDASRPDKLKEAVTIRINFEALPVGATVTSKSKIDRGSWVSGSSAVAGDTEIAQNVNKRFREIQVGIELTATTTTPVIVSITLIYEDLQNERD